MLPFRLDRLVVLFLFFGVITACQQAPPPQPTPDIPATVTAQVQQHLESQPAPTPSYTSSQWETYENQMYGYVIRMPVGWLAGNVTASTQKVAFRSRGTPHSAVVGFVRAVKAPMPSLDAGMDAWLRTIEMRPHKSFQLLNRSKVRPIGEQTEVSVYYRLDRTGDTGDNCPRQHLSYLRTGQSGTYLLELSVCVAASEQYGDTFDAIYYSFAAN